MKRRFSTGLILTVFIFAFLNCTDMNDKHDIYLVGGEEIYIGKVDSLNVFPGNNRVKIRFWASDPRCKAVGFFWSPFNDSTFVNINKTSSIDSFEVIIGDTISNKEIKEGTYTFKVFTYDNKNHRSVPFEKIVKVYGEKYQAALSNRVLISKMYSSVNGNLLLSFGMPINEDDIGLEISYSDRDGFDKDTVIVNEDITFPVILPIVDSSKEVAYRTLYLPEPLAIDTFEASPKMILLN